MDTERKIKAKIWTQRVWILSPHFSPLLQSAADDVSDDFAQHQTGFYIQSNISVQMSKSLSSGTWDTGIPVSMNLSLLRLQNLIIRYEST